MAARKVLSERGYAKHRGCARSSVQEARESGRLTAASISRDSRGRLRIDVEAADREWAATTRTEYVPLGIQARKACLPAPELANLIKRLSGLMADLQADSRRVAATFLPGFIEGAMEALLGAGRPATAAELTEAFAFDHEDSPLIVGPLLDAVDDLDMTPDAIRALARRAGRRAVLGDAVGLVPPPPPPPEGNDLETRDADE